MNKDSIKLKYPLCFSVAYCEARRFIYQAFRVKEDQQFILKLISKNDKKTLDFMEEFYKTVIKEGRSCEKDLYSRNNFHLLPLEAIGELGSGLSDDMKEFEQIKIKSLKSM